MNLWHAVRPLVFNAPVDPETSHDVAIHSLSLMGRSPAAGVFAARYRVEHPALRTTVAGISFDNPVGMGAGFDKNGVALPGLDALGFGFVEVGTVTQHAQPGQPKPRIFRIERDRALINRMGFNNRGVDALMRELASGPKPRGRVGISIGKSLVTPVEQAVGDYLYSFERAHPRADYIAVNVSSPNTQGLRSLQGREPLVRLLGDLQRLNREMSGNAQALKPMFLKVAPDLEEADLGAALEVCEELGLGMIATNTTLSRAGLTRDIEQAGGLSGHPLKQRALAVVRFLRGLSPSLPLIGVGGIFTGDDAFDFLAAGADLIQVYTGFVYEGPGIARSINRQLVRRMERLGVKSVAELRS